MKILISNDNYSAHYYERLGWARALEASGHQVYLWQINGISPFDIFDDFEPDIFLGQTYNITKSLIQVIEERPNLLCWMKAGDFGYLVDNYPKGYEILTASEQEKKNVEELFKKTGKPQFIGCHYLQHRLEETHGYWKNLGPQLFSMPLASDIFDYTNGQECEEFKCDMMFIGGEWKYKKKSFDEFLYPLFNPKYNYKIKIFGNSVWGTSNYCGQINNNMVKHALKSATVCPNISEPHARDINIHAEICERPFKLASNKCFCITDYSEDLLSIFSNDEMPIYKNANEFHEIFKHFIRYPHERSLYIQRAYDICLNQHTYFHRIESLFSTFKLYNMVDKIQKFYQDTKEKLKL